LAKRGEEKEEKEAEEDGEYGRCEPGGFSRRAKCRQAARLRVWALEEIIVPLIGLGSYRRV